MFSNLLRIRIYIIVWYFILHVFDQTMENVKCPFFVTLFFIITLMYHICLADCFFAWKCILLLLYLPIFVSFLLILWHCFIFSTLHTSSKSIYLSIFRGLKEGKIC
uniref:Uncharacterized protein n=1 Tax=Cacopsylla melanoneura TaxID=428564 RepID=A0A8D8MG47_9HEMI